MAKLHARVRKEMGEDAVIVDTRTLHRNGAPSLIEMIAGRPDRHQEFTLEVQHTVIEATLMRAEYAGSRISVADFDTLLNRAGAEGPIEGHFTGRPAADSEPPAWLHGFVNNAPAAPVEYEMSGSSNAISWPVAALEEEPAAYAPLSAAAAIHPYRFGAELLDAGLTLRAVDAVADYAPAAESAVSALAHTLGRPVRYPSDRHTAVMTVQGPAGSGRTTALMRMALDCAESGRETILVASDSTRAAARDQVHFYAEVLGLQSVDAYTNVELELIASRANPGACLFVDVAPGVWRRPPALLVEHFAYRALPAHWEISAARGEFGRLAKSAYSGCIPTFTDLASGMSLVLSLALEAELGLAFLSSNRDVSTGIALADPNTLASGVLHKSSRETSDGRLVGIA